MLPGVAGEGGASRDSAVPDVLAPGLRCVFCGINPGRVSAAAAAHFANPRNDFWPLLDASGLTPRQLDPQEQFDLLDLGYGITNAAMRTTPGSGDLRRGDFDGSAARLEGIARDLAPLAIAFVGKEAYRGAFNERPELGLQGRRLADTLLFVLPSTSPANAAVPWAERLRWFEELRRLLEPSERVAVRALVVDAQDRVLLLAFRTPGGREFWATPGGAIDPGESEEDALRRELREEAGLHDFELGAPIWTREHEFVWHRPTRQRETYFLVRVEAHDAVPELDLAEEGVHGHRWWTLGELEETGERLVPRRLPELVGDVLRHGPPGEPVDAGV
jgi:double-stranded uracil-DNA glycosylase